MNWIVVRTAELWPCAIVRESDIPNDGFLVPASITDAAKRLDMLIENCDGPDEVHNTLNELGITYEEINDVATVTYGGK